MPRLAIPATVDVAPASARPQLEAVKNQIGSVPNLFRRVASSPAAPEGCLGMSGALAKGRLPAPTCERIALAVAQVDDCGECLSAHGFMGKNLAKLSDAEIAANCHGGSLDQKADAVVRMASDDDAHIVENVRHVALNTWTNDVNSVAGTEIEAFLTRKWQCERGL